MKCQSSLGTVRMRDLDGKIYFGLRENGLSKLAGPGTLVVLRGRAWVTVKGQPRDWFLGAGKQFELHAGQQLWVQGDPRCVLGWKDCADAALGRRLGNLLRPSAGFLFH